MKCLFISFIHFAIFFSNLSVGAVYILERLSLCNRGCNYILSVGLFGHLSSEFAEDFVLFWGFLSLSPRRGLIVYICMCAHVYSILCSFYGIWILYDSVLFLPPHKLVFTHLTPL